MRPVGGLPSPLPGRCSPMKAKMATSVELRDRFGNPIVPREWFLVPVFVIHEAVERIKDGTITDYRYDPKTASLIRAAN